MAEKRDRLDGIIRIPKSFFMDLTSFEICLGFVFSLWRSHKQAGAISSEHVVVDAVVTLQRDFEDIFSFTSWAWDESFFG